MTGWPSFFFLFFAGNALLLGPHNWPENITYVYCWRGFESIRLGQQRRQVLRGHSDNADHSLLAGERSFLNPWRWHTQKLVVMTEILGLWSAVLCREITCHEGLQGMHCEGGPQTPAGAYCIIWPPKVTSASAKIIHNDLISPLS